MLTLNGPAVVESISPRGPPEPVYNLEVQVDHVYHVAEAGVLVHNNGLTILNPCFTPTNEARRNFGTAVHQDFPDEFARNYPNAKFSKHVGPGEKGPDIRIDPQANVGFDFAELKPNTPGGRDAFSDQLARWKDQGITGRFGLFTYDPATGIIDFGSFTIVPSF